MCHHAKSQAWLCSCPLLLWVSVLRGSTGPGLPQAAIGVSPAQRLAGTPLTLAEHMRLPLVRERNSCSHTPQKPLVIAFLSVLSIHLGWLKRQPSEKRRG